MKERVLVVKTEDLITVIGNKTGFIEYDKRVLDFIKTKGFFADREKAETNESLKQVIPYCMVFNNRKILVVKRKNPSEKRLRGLFSIGIGGHINPIDVGGDIMFNASIRELKEETDFKGNLSSQIIGFLSLNDTPVSRVHFGVVYKILLDKEIRVADNGLEGSLKSWHEMKSLIDKMEGWSKILGETITIDLFAGR